MEHYFHQTERLVYDLAEWIKLAVELIGVAIILWGIVFSLVKYGGQLFGKQDVDYVPLRLSLARYLIVALEFQLAADILGTAIAPSWDAIGKLAAIAVIRTVLNFFLEKEMKEEVKEQKQQEREALERRMDE